MKIVNYLSKDYKTITIVSTLFFLPGSFVQDAQQILLFHSYILCNITTCNPVAYLLYYNCPKGQEKEQIERKLKEMKENILAYIMSTYMRLAYTPAYIFGYAIKGTIYAARVTNADAILPYIASLDRASSKNGGTYSAKYKPNTEKWAIIMSAAVEIRPICTVDYMEQRKVETHRNRGQLFEDMVAATFNMEQVDSKNAKFTKCGDVIAKDGTHYQVKYNKATFSDERTLHNLMSA